jgi:hypothetical protein
MVFFEKAGYFHTIEYVFAMAVYTVVYMNVLMVWFFDADGIE